MPKAKSKKSTTAKSKAKAAMLVNVLLDRSGSMAGIRAKTISGYNEYLNGLKSDKTTDYSITLLQFDSMGAEPSLLVNYTDKPLAEVPELVQYEPRGGTPLYDAIGESVRRVEAKGRPVITVIITDGEENSSKEFSKENVKTLIQQKEAEGWTFVFLGADIDSYQAGRDIGTSVHSTANYSKSRVGETYTVLADATMTRSANVQAHGVQAAQNMAFFSNEMKNAMVGEDIADNLNISGNVTTTNHPTGGGSPAEFTFQGSEVARNPRSWTISK